MESHTGIAVGPGIAIGRVFVLRRDPGQIPVRRIGASEVDAECGRLSAGMTSAAQAVASLRGAADASPEVSAILASHEMLLLDPALRGSIERRIRVGLVDAETAAVEALDAFAARFDALPDAYMRQRASDVRDVRRRLLDVMRGSEADQLARLSEPVILAARELTPSETAALDRKRTLGFVTAVGGPTSHTAIIARNLGLPAVVGLGDQVAALADGQIVIVDGLKGVVIVDPDAATLARYEEHAARFARWVRDLKRIRDFPAETRDGHQIRLMGNIELPSEVDAVLRAGGDGIGLFRTEFLCQKGKAPPTEDEHYQVYSEALRKLGGRPLTIRTFDFGADKGGPAGEPSAEPNPALGVRSIRLCLEQPQLFMPQLRGILRASAHGNVRCLFPMISSLSELRRAKELLDRARTDLRADGVHVADSVPVGVMVEIPAAAVIVDLLADEVDFLSIGSNDLIQYALAVDRVNAKVAHLYEPAHPAILRLVDRVVRAASDRGVPVSLCGEMAGDRLFTVLLVGMGFRDLSLSPRAIPEIKMAIRSITVEQARRAAAWCADAKHAAEVRKRLLDVVSEQLPSAF
ncbi:MAG: phosphoenolpyruvate--protein phosphotransferase [Planctomycetes bacterium]|nr:phosphoenolpyruvate--protein phosphotransferase [Planctomycetota bacterium]